jgi:hypothetical protein
MKIRTLIGDVPAWDARHHRRLAEVAELLRALWDSRWKTRPR